MTSSSILIVGAGFAGAVHARVLAEAGWDVRVIDRRDHLAGNAYDEVDGNGLRVHRYGPHLFHTSNETVVSWIRRFATFLPYAHQVQALLPDDRLVPLPIDRRTVAAVLGIPVPDETTMRDVLARESLSIANPRNAGEYLASRIGVRLTDLFFRPYTQKMWALDLEEMDAAVVQRIPLRYDENDLYFPDDTFQGLPEGGYTAMFERIFEHPRITVALGTEYVPELRCGMAHCFNSMSIDEHYDYVFGRLPYRSIRFHHQDRTNDAMLGNAATINFTDASSFTRRTDWEKLPGHRVEASPRGTVTLEEPCAAEDNNWERYYPIKSSDGRNVTAYKRYSALATEDPGMTFIGRCGTYQYLDMHQVINQSLASARRWLDSR